MVASWSLALLDLLSLSVYIDLFLVNKYQVHIFTPLLKYIKRASLKQLQVAYNQSLQRNFFCVSDKVDVSGTSFTVVFCGVYILSLLSNLFGVSSTTYHFYLIGVPYFIYLLFCMHFYRSRRELCFYCKYALCQNFVLLVIMMVFYLESVPKLYLWATGLIFFGSLIGRGMTRRQRAKELRKKARTTTTVEEEEVGQKIV